MATTEFENDLLLDHVDLMTELSQVLSRHPSGTDIRLIFAPAAYSRRSGEVLIQESADNESVTLKWVAVADLKDSDTLIESQLLNPADDEFNQYASEIRAAQCLVRYDLKKNATHIYD